MTPTKDGSFRLFRFSGIDVYLHWSWLLIAYLQITMRKGAYDSPVWNAIEYVTLFVIVLLHEFGHSLACRQVGGRADQIVLWPLGGVAYVQPPPRPGPTLWSIAAGPLVNVVLFFVFTALWQTANGWAGDNLDAARFLRAVWFINLGLLIFNLLPIYPLDGGQILQSLLWFWLGRARSLLVASIIGFIGVAGLVALAVFWQSIWTGIMAAFVFMNCRQGFLAARALAAADKIPRHSDQHCPSCHGSPPAGEFWKCGRCGTAFDLFATRGRCPQCLEQFATANCLLCGASAPLDDFARQRADVS